ncbi:GAF domain-containing hybrid sensor histidine kinase/response regulator [Roseofilum casamattae]|uniref:histidine kinase n=1 Tax=Roseofilum casamattae BLCC-M143 TaxID=3022442 RepID=A0ABT7BY24_9CYAN|nr:GAF domain-containing hybrid sensor histidine kinase/response regulator [Roseofilum casamattae]MDJ1183351.1 response regulator [Roseofilum casamattae BLCC-M143]
MSTQNQFANSISNTQTTFENQNGRGRPSQSLDVAAAIALCRELSSELDRERLIAKLVKVLRDYAGATKCAVILPAADRWYAAAIATLEGEPEVSCDRELEHPLLESGHRVPLSVVCHIQQTGETVVVDDLGQANSWNSDRYFQSHHTTSIFGFPLLQSDRIIGIIYLENNQMLSAFAPDLQDVLLLLGTQIALALEHAQSYRQLKQTIKAQARELRQVRVRAEAADRAKKQFLANMSHELRTPLNGILGYAQIVKRSPTLDTEQRYHIDAIEQSGNHLLNLINDILDLSKIAGEKIHLNPQENHLQSFLLGIARISQMNADCKGIHFHYHADRNLPQLAIFDAQRLRQVLLHLLGNSMKFTESGFIKFSITANSLAETDASTVNLKFTIEDTRVQFNKPPLDAIGLPFELVGEESEQADDIGLTRSISAQILALMNSQIEVSTTPQQGCMFCFNLELPIVAPNYIKVRKGMLQSPVGYQGEMRKILVVDDKLKNREILRSILVPLGFKFHEASHGQEGLEFAKTWQPDLIITDLVMPVLDGFEMTKYLRDLPEFCETIIIACSPSILPSDRFNSFQVGCNGFLEKPIDIDCLLESLQDHLQLDWIYPELPTIVEKKIEQQPNLIFPPEQELLVLLRAAKIGDVMAIEQEGKRLRELDDRYLGFSDRILELVAEFNDREIVKLIEQRNY